jgi:hypothetical protein
MTDESHDDKFQTIGSLTSKIADSLKNKVLTSGALLPSGTNSLTGTARKPMSLPTTTPLGERGLAVAPNSLRQMVATSRNPAEVDRSLRASLHPLVELSSECEWLTEDPHQMGEIRRFSVSGEKAPDGLQSASELINAVRHPLPIEDIIAALTNVRVLTISRASTSEDLDLTLAAFADALSEFPADIVRKALRDWPQSHKYWPTLAEIRASMEPLLRERGMISDAIERAQNGNFADRENGAWPSWLEKIWGKLPNGLQQRLDAIEGQQRSPETPATEESV